MHIMDQVAQIREKIDIVSLISEYIPLKKMGRNFKATCPFHSEKTPSFVVSPERQIWHCFGGCSKGGDCYTFLMEYEKMEFVEALRILAKRTGIELEGVGKWDSGITSKKENIYTLNNLSCEFYHYVLTKHNAGKKALEYLTKKRKIDPRVIETFKLGFSPSFGNALCGYLEIKKGYKRSDILEAGLATERGGRLTDFFSNRIMFPLFDHRNNIVGFSGRVMSDESPYGSKYVNTRETLVYHKGSHFFGIHTALPEIKKTGKAIVMEGEFDVISSFQNGIRNAIAVKGTALTDNQAMLLSRFSKKVSLCFDDDTAGREAVKRSVPALEKKHLTTSVVVIPKGKDPDEAIKEDSVAFKKAVEKDIGVYDFLISKVLSSFDKKTAEGKKRITEEILPMVSSIENEVVKEHYLKRLSIELETSFESIVREVEKMAQKEPLKTKIGQEERKRERQEVLEEYLLALIVQYKSPREALGIVKDLLIEFQFITPSYDKLFNSFYNYFTTTSLFDREKFISLLPKELINVFDTCYLFPLTLFEDDLEYLQEIRKTAKELQIIYLRSQMTRIGEEMKNKEKLATEEEMQKLQDKLSHFVSLLKKNE
ncbi:MAG: DNA primase [bacterium]|nr:DNA primase [bacterium]